MSSPVREIRFVDTTLRDGQMSLWGTRMRTSQMVPALSDIDAAGFEAAEFIVPGAQFARAVRDLKEDPWEWLKEGTSRVHATSLRLHGAIESYFGRVPLCVQELFLDKLVELGINTTRISNPWNDYEELTAVHDLLKRHEYQAVVNIIYSVSPLHTNEYYAEKARAAAALKPYRICFKDVGGLLTPEAARTLLPIVIEQVGEIPIEFHAHCNNGMAPYCTIIAVEAGIDIVHTAIPPLANGSSQPSVFNVAENLRAKGFTTMIDTAPLERVRDHFSRVADEEGLPKGVPAEYEERFYHHQVPGGMISNLRFQLGQVGKEDRLEETLDETARVREEFGYPIMVTPYSQFVGTQAAINVMTGERYSVVSDEVIYYSLGRWGRQAATAMETEIRARILDRPRARELEQELAQLQDEPTLAEIRKTYGGKLSDEELIVRIVAGVGDAQLDLTRGPMPNTYEEYANARHPLTTLVNHFADSRRLRRLQYRTADAELLVEKAK